MNQVKTSLHPRARGFSLVELLVAMAIGLVVTLAITRVMVTSEQSKRTTTAVGDTVQSAAFTGYQFDLTLRQAGTGYTQRVAEMFGCRLNARRTSTGSVALPRPSAYTGAFANASLVRRLAPVLIEQDAANSGAEVRGDILTVMSGAGGKSEIPLAASTFTLLPSPGYTVPFNGEYKPNDLVLISADLATGRECMVQQVGNVVTVPSGTAIPLAGDFYSPLGTTMNFADFTAGGSSAFAAIIGNVANPPRFHMFAVGDGGTLFSFDLLQLGATPAETVPLPMADNIVELRALYGLDINRDRTVDRWQSPGVAPFRYADLTDGSAAALGNLRQIMAIRIGMVLRSPLQEKDPVDAAAPVLFEGLVDSVGTSLQRTRTLATTAERSFRYRTVDMVIPLRNMHFAPLP